MNASQWQSKLGEDTWKQIMHAYNKHFDSLPEGVRDSSEEQVARALVRACQLGFTYPEKAPTLSTNGRALLLSDGTTSMTAEGLIAFYAAKGQGFLVLRMAQLLRGCRETQLLARLQEILGLYEAQCAADSVVPLPDDAPSVIVGGERAIRDETSFAAVAFMEWIIKQSPPPDPGAVTRAHAGGPGVGA